MNGEIIAITTIGGTLVLIVGFVLGNARIESRKRNRIFERMDENKKEADETYVRKDICSITHEQVSRDLKDIKTDLKKLLFKNGIK